jgi:hypothetical protein
MPASRLAISLLAAALLLLAGPARADIPAEELTDEHVRRAIAAIVEELYRRKDPERFWNPVSLPTGESARQEGGYTALTVLALLTAGESYQDHRLRDAVMYLERLEMRGTYAVAIRTAVWAKLPSRFHPLLEADAKWLLDGFSERSGGWDYVLKPGVRAYDNSLRQYGALALWEAAKRGVRIDRQYWQAIEQTLLDVQLPDGGWNYKIDQEPSGSMTTAGLATLFITQDFLHAADDVPLRRGGSPPRHAAGIAHGLDWMRANYEHDRNPGTFRDFYYYSYGVERVGLASGLKSIGGRDWYREGAAEIIRRLCEWDPKTQAMTVRGPGNRLDATHIRFLDFGLMFLSRGRVPVAVNKLAATDLRWNNRPRDAANLTRHITASTETDLSWQIVSIDDDPHTWLDAPILYLASDEALPWLADVDVDIESWQREARAILRRRASGTAPPNLAPPDALAHPAAGKIRTYLDAGGLLCAVQEGRGNDFAESVQALGTLLYPQHEWRELPETHWAYRIHARVGPKRPPLLALSNGVRELIVLAPGSDLAAAYQVAADESDVPLQVGANLYLYASELNRPRPRLARHAAPASTLRSGRPLQVVRAMHAGAWNPEPAAIEAIRGALGAHGLDLNVIEHPLAGIATLEPAPALVLACGIDEHRFTDAERAAVRRYVDEGGVILFETPGGAGAFTISAEQTIAREYRRPIRSLMRHAVITAEGVPGATPLGRVEYRPFAMEIFGARESKPRLRGMRFDGEARILFSREDISHALLDQPRWGVCGYAPASARDLLVNVILYAKALRDEAP